MRQVLSRFTQSVRFRLTLWYVAILAVILLVTGSAVYFSEAHALTEALGVQLDTRMETLARSYNHQTGLLAPAVDDQSSGMVGDNPLTLLMNPQGRLVQTFGDVSQPSEAFLFK